MSTAMGSTRRKRENTKRIGWLTEAQAVLGWAVILILVALLGALYLNQASHIASVGRRVQVLQNKLETLKRENATLARQIAESQSLEWLQQEAIRLGFVPARPDDIEYIIVPNYPVDPLEEKKEFDDSAPQDPASAMPIETFEEALWLTFKAGIGNLIYGEASEQ